MTYQNLALSPKLHKTGTLETLEAAAQRVTAAALIVKRGTLERATKAAHAREEARVIRKAGGEKQLGSNEAARKRAFAMTLEHSFVIEIAEDRLASLVFEIEEARAASDAHDMLARLDKATITALGNINRDK
jgi:hypothetical protein